MVRTARVFAAALVGGVLWSQQALAWPPTDQECERIFRERDLPKVYMFVDDNGALEQHIEYSDEEIALQVVRSTTGRDLLDADVLVLNYFRRIKDKQDINGQNQRIFEGTFAVGLEAKETFQVLAVNENDGKGWRPKIVKREKPLRFAAYVKKGTIFDGTVNLLLYGPFVTPQDFSGPHYQPPPTGQPPLGQSPMESPPPPRQEAVPWWKKR